MIPFRKSIGFRLLIVSFILLALPLLVDSFVLAKRRFTSRVGEAKDYLQQAASLREIPLFEIQPLSRPLLEVFSYFFDLESDFPQKPSDELNQALKDVAKIGGFSGIFMIKITDSGQFIVVGSNLPFFIGRDYTKFYQANELASEENWAEGYMSYISYNSRTGEFYLEQGRVIFEGTRPVGLMVLSDDAGPRLGQLLKAEEGRYPVKFALVLPSSIVFAATDPQLQFQYFDPIDKEDRALFLEEDPYADAFFPEKPLPVKRDAGSPFFEFEWENKTQIGYIKKIAGSNYSLLTYASKRAIFEKPIFSFFKIYGQFGLILVLGGGVAYFVIRRLAWPMRKLSAVMLKIKQGDLSARYTSDRFGYEINTLGTIFNEMISNLIEEQRAVAKQRVEKEKWRKELLVGQEVQKKLLPHEMPHYPGVELAETYIPAIEVGGDFYDAFVKESTDQLFLAVADGSGKGVGACFYSLSLRDTLRTYARAYEDVAEAIDAANTLFIEDTGDTGMFVTVFLGRYDRKDRTFHYFSAGHNPPYLCHTDGSIEELSHGEMAMGVLPYPKIESASATLESGDVLLLYTDGATEAHNLEKQLFGEARLQETLKALRKKSASEIREGVLEKIRDFVGQAPPHDDLTLIVMKVL